MQPITPKVVQVENESANRLLRYVSCLVFCIRQFDPDTVEQRLVLSFDEPRAKFFRALDEEKFDKDIKELTGIDFLADSNVQLLQYRLEFIGYFDCEVSV